MKVSKYLIITKSGNISRTVNNITQASVKHNEYAIYLKLNIPNNAFDRIFPTIDIDVKEDNIIKPKVEVEVEEIDDGKLSVDIKAKLEAKGFDCTLKEVEDMILSKRETDEFFNKTKGKKDENK